MREEDFLRLLWRRYGDKKSLGDAPRYVVAEHPRTPLGDNKNMRVLDCLVLDRHCDYGEVVSRDANYNPTYSHAPLFPVLGFEIKVSRGDWLRELRDPSKSEAWRKYCSSFYVVAPVGIVEPKELPAGWGLMVPRGSGLAAKVKAGVREPQPMPSPVVAGVAYAAIRTGRKY